MDLANENLIEKLNELYAGEWLAMYQYWLGAKLIKNNKLSNTIKELEKHAKEEMGHAVLLANTIIQLGGVPVISPDRLTSNSCCAYLAPSDPDVMSILSQNILGEEDAVIKYNAVLPYSTNQEIYNMLVRIRKDEEEHISDLKLLKTAEGKGVNNA